MNKWMWMAIALAIAWFLAEIKFFIAKEDLKRQAGLSRGLVLTLNEFIREETKRLNNQITPNEFLEGMKQIAEIDDTERSHIEMDELMCKLLVSLGYEDGVEVFKNAIKWYS